MLVHFTGHLSVQSRCKRTVQVTLDLCSSLVKSQPSSKIPQPQGMVFLLNINSLKWEVRMSLVWRSVFCNILHYKFFISNPGWPKFSKITLISMIIDGFSICYHCWTGEKFSYPTMLLAEACTRTCSYEYWGRSDCSCFDKEDSQKLTIFYISIIEQWHVLENFSYLLVCYRGLLST